MSKSIKPNTEVFQYAIRYLPTGKYLKKTPGSSFYETDIPSVYVSPKVAKKSLENEARWGRYKPEDCEIVKFRLIMEEVKEPTPAELEYQEELKNINMLRRVLGDVKWEEVESERGKWELFRYIQHLDNTPASKGSSLHCFDEVHKTSQGTFQLAWSNDQSRDEMPLSISRAVDYNWDDRIMQLKLKNGIRL